MKRMAEAGVEPNVVSYCAMIDACSKAGDAARAGYWHEVRSSGCRYRGELPSLRLE